MKKLLLVLAIGAFAACNDSSTTSTDTAGDSLSTQSEDSKMMVDPNQTATVDSMQAGAVDSLKTDTLKK